MSGAPHESNPFQEALNMSTAAAIRDLTPVVKKLNAMNTRESKLSAEGFSIILRWMASCTSVSSASQRPDPSVYNMMMGTTSGMSGGMAVDPWNIMAGKSDAKVYKLKPVVHQPTQTMNHPPPQPTKRRNKLSGYVKRGDSQPTDTKQRGSRLLPRRF
eukprot:1382247-Amorphochlora_amoeboformis.AAC.2